jgi:hypothetical protein
MVNCEVARPERFELPTSWFVARRSIQLSYGRKGREYYHNDCRSPFPQLATARGSTLAQSSHGINDMQEIAMAWFDKTVAGRRA